MNVKGMEKAERFLAPRNQTLQRVPRDKHRPERHWFVIAPFFHISRK
jgi:hypothetical protein